MSAFRLIDTLLRRISFMGFVAASALLLSVGVLGAVDVIMTNLFLMPVPGMVELSGALLAVIVFLGLAEAQARGSNIVIDIATQNMGPRLRRASSAVSLALSTIVMTLIAWQATKLAASAWHLGETALGALAFPLAPFKSVACFGAWLAAAEFARQWIRVLIGLQPNGQGAS